METGIGITVMGSGSSGNSILVHNKENGILIDAGFSRKELLRRFEVSNLNPEIVRALLITHEHTDHVKGCRVLADHLKIPTYTTDATREYLAAGNKISKNVVSFMPGDSFDLEEFSVTSFEVQHDSVQAVGFLIKVDGLKIGIATDLGQLNRLVKQRLHDCDALILESNYDEELLRTSSRPLSLQRRIMGRHGHLNNIAAVEGLEELLTPRTKYLCFAHLSSECNNPELVKDLAIKKLTNMDRQDILLNIAEQARPLPTVWL